MPISEKQRIDRRRYIGSSDMPALILPDFPWASAYDVWLSKTGRLPAMEPNDAMISGTYLERGILDWAADNHLGPIKRNQFRRRPEFFMGAHIDGITAKGEPVEAKATFYGGSNFGSPGTDQVPDHFIVQCQHHMICLEHLGNPQVCHVPVLMKGKLEMFRVPKSEALCNGIKNTSLKFWTENVIPNKPPAGCVASDESNKNWKRDDKATTVIPESVVETWLQAKQIDKTTKALFDEAKAALLAAMGDHRIADAGIGIVRYPTMDVTRVDTERLKRDGIYEAYKVTKTQAGRLSFTPNKENENVTEDN